MLTGVSDRPWGVGVRVCKLSQGEDFDLGHTSGSFLGEFISGWAELAWHLEATPRLSTSISSQVAACSWHAEEKCERQWGGAARYKWAGNGDMKAPFCDIQTPTGAPLAVQHSCQLQLWELFRETRRKTVLRAVGLAWGRSSVAASHFSSLTGWAEKWV